MKKVAISYGVEESKLRVVLNPNKFENISFNRGIKNKVVYFGRLSSEKNLFQLLALYKLIQDSDQIYSSNLVFTIAGEGPLLNKLKNISLKKNINIEFTDKLDFAGIKKLLTETKIAVFPSKIPENGPLGVIEAVANGCYVIGNNKGGMAEYLDYFPCCSKINIEEKKEFITAFKSFLEIDKQGDGAINQSIFTLNDAFSNKLYISKIMSIYNEPRS